MSLALLQKNRIQWMVYRDGELSVGPITSYEIRIALRQGTISLSDYAGQKNSILRFPIKDIDEIFYDTTPTKKDSRQNLINETKHNHQRNHSKLPAAPVKLVKSQDLALQKQTPIKNTDTNKNLEKIYFLKDRKGRKLGPMDEDEILVFAAKIKKLKHVRVLKLNSNQNIQLEKFVLQKHQEKSSNQKKKAHAFHPLTLLNEGLPSSRVIEELANFEALRSLSKSRESNLTLIAGVFLLFTLILVLLWQLKIINLNFQLPNQQKTYTETIVENRLFTAATPEPQNNRQINTLSPSSSTPVIPEPKKIEKNEPRSTIKLQKSKSNPSLQNPHRGLTNTNSNILNATQKSSIASTPSQIAVKDPSFQNPSRSSRKSGLRIKEMQNFSGEVVETSILFYSPTQVQKCSSKCMIDIKDETGDRAKLIFFKAAYGNQMIQRNGQTKVRARVSDGLTGLDLYLESLSSP